MRFLVAALAVIFVAGCNGQHAAQMADLRNVCADDLPPGCPSPPPSWSGTVATIVAERCVGCHSAGGDAAKIPLSTYSQVSGRQVATLTQISSCQMPPLDDPTVAEQVVLAPEERQAMLAWLVCGAPNN